MPYKNKQDLYAKQIERWRLRKAKAIAYLGGQCFDCGLASHQDLYDFHHRDPKEKKYSWTKLRLRSWSSVTEELDKCDLLCANCHRMRHAVS
jgi:hypothetical protein